MKKAEAIQKIALINMGGLGDAILFLPVIEAIQQLLPNAQLELITENRAAGIRALLQSNTVVKTINYQSQGRLSIFKTLLGLLFKGQYQAVLSSGSNPAISILLALSGIPIRIGYNTSRLSQKLLSQAAPLNTQQYASRMHYELALAFSKTIHQPLDTNSTTAIKPNNLNPELLKNSPQLFEAKKSPIIGVHPGVSLASIQKNILKGWPAEKWVQLCEQIQTEFVGAEIVLLGGPDDQAIIESIKSKQNKTPVTNLFGQTPTIEALATTLNQLDVLICVDSAPMHLAVCLNKPVVALFNSTDETKLLPETYQASVAKRPTEEVPCRPCLFDKRLQSCEAPICLDITVEEVLAKLKQTLHSITKLKASTP